MLLMLSMEDCSLRLIYDCRLPIGEAPLPLWRLKKMLFKVRNGDLTLRDVKNEDRPGYMYENTGNDDKMSGEKTGFYTKMYPLREDRQQSVGLIGRNCTSHAIIRGEVGHKIGSSAYRPIDPSAEHGVGFRWPDDPMAR